MYAAFIAASIGCNSQSDCEGEVPCEFKNTNQTILPVLTPKEYI